MPLVDRNRPANVNMGVIGFNAQNPPAHLQGLLALNPRLAQHLVSDPGLRAFLEANKHATVDFTPAQPPPGSVRDELKLDTWCHATSIVAPATRDEEYIVVVARGSAYPTSAQGDVQFPLQSGGKNGTSDGRIVYVGKTKDYLHTFVDDKDPHYPGAGAVSLDFPVFGKKGEQLELSYCRIKPDAQGRAHPHHAAWPDSFSGVFGGYSGRDQKLVLQGGAQPHLECPK